MRTLVASLVCGLLWLTGEFNPAAHAADERKVFWFVTPEGDGALIHDYAKRWVEMGQGHERFDFDEIARTNETVELLDRSRNVGLKVHADQGELRLNGSPNWQPWQHGKWIALGDLPKSTPFVPADQKIRLAYFVPGDRRPTEHYEQKIRVVMELVADIYRRDLKDKGYRSDGITLETNAAGEPIVHLIQTDKPAQYYNGAPAFDGERHFQRIMDEIPGTVGNPRRHTIVLLAETYEPGPAPIEWAGSVGRGGHFTADGGLAIMSSWILRDEFCAMTYADEKKLILDDTPIEGRTALQTRRLNSPRFEFIEDGFGAVVHELGHALGLPHDYRQPNDLMGHGFRDLQVNFRSSSDKKKRIAFSRDNARLLGVSRYLFPEIDRTDNTPPTADITVRVAEGSAPTASVSLKASDDRGLRAVVFYDPQNDTVIGGAEMKGREQAVNQKLPLKALKPGEFKLVTMLADAGGNIAMITTAAKPP